MVDVTSQNFRGDASADRLSAMPARQASTVSVDKADAATLASYRSFCAGKVTAPAQHPIWIEAWAEHINPDMVVVTLRREDRTVWMLPLEIVGRSMFRIARYPGGNHANGNFAPTPGNGMQPVTTDELTAMVAALKKARPDIDLLALERNAPELDQVDHPLGGLATQTSPNVSLAVDLREGFEALMSRMNGKRKRKKYSGNIRKFEELGGYAINEARSVEHVEHLLEQFFAMKARRFAKAGIPDVFADPAIQDFFRAIFVNSLKVEDHPFVIDALEVGGEIKAINGLSITKRSAICEFGTVCDENNRISPGFFLDYHHIAKYAAAGKCFFDFSVGDEPYKRSWCKVETRQFDCIAAVSLKGSLLYGYSRARSRAIAKVKSSARLLSAFKHARKLLTRSNSQ